MNYLLDTNIVSETIKGAPNKNLLHWLNQVSNESLYISVLTLGEIRKGVEKVIDLKRKNKLILWLENDLQTWFQDRILAIDSRVANKWGYLCARSKVTLPAVDSLIASVALTHNLKLVTRNLKDFAQYTELEVLNPFL